MSLTRHLRALVLLGSLTLVVGFLVPSRAWADCGCGDGCQCGDGCCCGTWSSPPPPDPAANRVRRDYRSLTDQERQDFIDAVKLLKQSFHEGATISIYDEYVMAHMSQQTEIHRGAAFFPWHRALVRDFELELQAINPNVTVPYWDFTVDNKPSSPLWSKDFMGGDGDPDDNDAVPTGPFRKGEWLLLCDGPHLRRHFGLYASSLPTPGQVDIAMQIKTYDSPHFDEGSVLAESFRCYMAGWNHPSGEPEMHNRVHNWVGGSMLLMTSPNDPVFWLVHSNLDRLWAQWEGLHGYDYPEKGDQFSPPNQYLHDILEPFGVTPADLLDHHELGYEYDTE